jgi:phage-related protein
VILSRGVKSSCQTGPDDFYKQVTGEDFNNAQVTKGAFTQARAHLKLEAFIELNQSVNKSFYATAPYHVWHHMRLVAAYGMRLVLPNHSSIKEKFGEKY